MQTHAITMLGTGLIGDFYTMTLHGQRGRDRVRVIYSRSEGRGAAFGERWAIPEFTPGMQAAIRRLDPTRPLTYAAPVGNEFSGINEVDLLLGRLLPAARAANIWPAG